MSENDEDVTNFIELKKPVKIFISYAHEDEKYREKLETHLSTLKRGKLIEIWHDNHIQAGEEWANAINEKLDSSGIILLLVSADFISSDYCHGVEVKRAVEHHNAGKARVIPIILKPCDWGSTPFSKLQAMPKNAKAVSKWELRDDAYNDIAQRIREVVNEIREEEEIEPKLFINEVLSPLPSIKSPTTPSSKIVLESPDGQVPLNSTYYVERPPIEADCFEEILKPGALIRIKAPRQMGKTSLMSRTLHHAATHSCLTSSINLELAEDDFLSNLDQFLQWFCSALSHQLNLANRVNEYWKDNILGAKLKCDNYFQRYLLTEVSQPLVLGLDEVDQLFKHTKVAQEFFGLLRVWHERAKNDPVWGKLRLVITHSKEVYIPLNIHESPFNVGNYQELPVLTKTQVNDLILRHGLCWTVEQLQQLMVLLGGHPYLVRVALYQIARGRLTLEQLSQVGSTEAGPYADHLRRHQKNLKEDSTLLIEARKVFDNNLPVEIGMIEAFKLSSMGLVIRLEKNKVKSLCTVYREYFRNQLEAVQ